MVAQYIHYLQIKAYTEGSVTPVEIYYGVPYATPPKGRYRFSVSLFFLISSSIEKVGLPFLKWRSTRGSSQEKVLENPGFKTLYRTRRRGAALQQFYYKQTC